MTKILLRVDDVGRTADDGPLEGSDGGLAHFAGWRQRSGLAGLPVVYGAVPAWVGDGGLRLLASLRGGEQLAVHGWDHAEGDPGLNLMARGRQALQRTGRPVDCYIPPRNSYQVPETLASWRAAGGLFLLGGFDGDHHGLGGRPALLDGLWHVPACPAFYGHAGALEGRLRAGLAAGTLPGRFVLTVHVPWDPDCRGLVELARPFLCSPEELVA